MQRGLGPSFIRYNTISGMKTERRARTRVKNIVAKVEKAKGHCPGNLVRINSNKWAKKKIEGYRGMERERKEHLSEDGRMTWSTTKALCGQKRHKIV